MSLSFSWWIKHLKNNPFKIISAFVLSFGGLILLTFFVRLGSMPELDFAGASATLAAVAVVGLLVVVAMSLTTIIPGIITRFLAVESPIIKSQISLFTLSIPGISIIFSIAIDAYFFDGENFKIYWIWIALASLIVSHLIIFIYRFNKNHNTQKNIISLLTEISNRPEVSNSRYNIEFIELKKDIINNISTTGLHSKLISDSFAYLLTGGVWLISSLMAIVIYITLADQGSMHPDHAAITLAAWGIVNIFLNILILLAPQKSQWTVIFASGIASIFVLTMLTTSWSAIPVAAIRTLGLGEVPVGVVVSADGCEIFNKSARGQQVCQMDSAKKTGWVCPVLLKSRIGSPMVFELTSFGDSGNWPLSTSDIQLELRGEKSHQRRYQGIQLDKSEVKSWPRINQFLAKQIKFDEEKTSPHDSKEILSLNKIATYLDIENDFKYKEQRQWIINQCGQELKNSRP